MSFADDLDAIFRDLHGLPGGATVLTLGHESHRVEPGEPSADLNPTFEGEDTEKSATVILRARDWSHLPDEGDVVTYAGATWRVTTAQNNVDGLTVTLTLGSERR